MSYITTVTGKHFYPLNPDQQNIDIEDIAHALSLICRANIFGTFIPLRSTALPAQRRPPHAVILWRSFTAACCTTRARRISVT